MIKERLISIPSRSPVKRIPGKYQDIHKSIKKRNNYMILHSCKMLESFYNKNGITALILDGSEMRTTKVLKKLGNKLKKIDIVEYDKETFNRMKSQVNNYKINLYQFHLKNFLEWNKFDPYTNVFYLDAMGSLFSSGYSYGSDILVNEFLKKNKCDEIILGITFCLRDGTTLNFKAKEKKSLVLLEKIFEVNGFNHVNLTSYEDSRYKGQNMSSRSMMFYLFYLKRI